MDLFDEELLSKQDGRDGEVTVTFEGNVAIVHMKCGQNRFNLSFVKKLEHALDAVERNENAQVLITTSEGKFYSNGLDLEWMALLSKSQGTHFFEQRLPALMWRIMTFPMPTIAAVNGHAFAMGAFLSLAQDYIIMSSEKGWWCFNEVHIRTLFPDFYKAVLRCRLPMGSTYHKAAVMGHRYTGQEAVQERIAMEACPQHELVSRAKALGHSLLRREPYDRESLRNMKKDIYKTVEEEKMKLLEKSIASKL